MDINKAIHESTKRHDSLRYFAYKLSHNNTDAEDLVQTAYLKMLKTKDSLDPANIPGLLATIIRHEAYNNYKKNKRIEYRKIQPEELVCEPENEIEEEISDSLINAIRTVPLKAALYLLALGGGQSTADIAAKEEISENTVRTRICQARAKLLPLLEKAYRTCLPRAAKKRDERLFYLASIA